MPLQFIAPECPQRLSTDEISKVLVDPGFGQFFSDHMAVAEWTQEGGWTNGRLEPYASFAMPPASAVFHYAQEVFEGLKAYRHADGSVWLFRPEANAMRLNSSARRLALPQLEVDDFLASVRGLVELDECWVPSGQEQSLYLRPFLMANESFLGVRAAQSVTYAVIASPVGAYFSGGVHPVSIWVSTELSRVAAGGTGAAKCGGNYAASLAAQNQAQDNGCSQVLFVDAATRQYVEELGGMNVFFVTDTNELVTPELNGNILPGITRDSILKVAPELGLVPVERPVKLAELLDGIDSGVIRSVFACGTAAVVTPIGRLLHAGREHIVNDDVTMTLAIRDFLLDIQYGRRVDNFGWMKKVCE